MIRLSNQGQGPKMQYMLEFYENEAEVAAQRDNAERAGPYWDAWNAYMGALYPTGIVLKGDALLPPSAATSVRLEGGNRLVQDGPVAVTKEQLAGFYMIEARDLNEAIQIASKIPPARVGCVEVRPIRPIRETVAVNAQQQLRQQQP